jgi:uncharacterized protein YjiS (DUF1127 family)
MLCGLTVAASIYSSPFGWAAVRLNPKIGVFAMFTTITRRPSLRTKAFGFDDLIGQGPRVTSLIAGLASTIRRWVARSQQRRALREIAERNDHHLLKDIGVSQEEAFREADKPFWRR